MVITLRTPSLIDVVDLIESGYRAYYGTECLGQSVLTTKYIWTPDDVKRPRSNWQLLPEEIQSLYVAIEDRNLVSDLQKKGNTFAATISTYTHDTTERNLELRTRVFNVTHLEDVLNGQTFSPGRSKFNISSEWHSSYRLDNKWNPEPWYNHWVVFRDTLVNQARLRIFGF